MNKMTLKHQGRLRTVHTREIIKHTLHKLEKKDTEWRGCLRNLWDYFSDSGLV